MYSIQPQNQNKLNAIAVIVCFVCGFGLFAASISNTSLPFVTLTAQLCGVLSITAGIYLYGKFMARTYTYSVQPGGIFDTMGQEIYDLIVIETTGKRKQRVVCRISLRDIVRVEARPARVSKKKGQGKLKPGEGGQVFSYCVDLVPQKVLVVYDTDGNAVVLTYVEQLHRILTQE